MDFDSGTPPGGRLGGFLGGEFFNFFIRLVMARSTLIGSGSFGSSGNKSEHIFYPISCLTGIRVVGKNEKLESFAEIGKNQAKLERTERSWKEPSEVEKFILKL